MNIPGNLRDGNDLTRGKTEVTFVIGGGVSEALLGSEASKRELGGIPLRSLIIAVGGSQ